MKYLLFDIGATKTRIAISSNKKSFGEPLIFDTPKNYDQAINLLTKTACDMAAENISKAIGGLPGYVDQTGKLHIWRNLKTWKGKKIKNDLSKRLNCEVALQNDTALVGLGEAIVGAGKDYKIVAYITLSTGINGVRIVDKKIDVNARGFEIGHQIIDFDKSYGDGNFEKMISGADLLKKHKKDPSNITSRKTWNEVERIIAFGLNNTILHWSPDVVILGGGLMNKINIKNVSKHLRDILYIYPNLPPIIKAKLGDLGGLHGALHYFKY